MHFRKKKIANFFCKFLKNYKIWQFFYYIIKSDFQKLRKNLIICIPRGGIFRKIFLLPVRGILIVNTLQKISSKYLP